MTNAERDDAYGPNWGILTIAVIAVVAYLLAVSRCGNQPTMRDVQPVDTVTAPPADTIKITHSDR